MENNPVDKVKSVTVKHINNVCQYLLKEGQGLIPLSKMLDICEKVSNEIIQTSIDVGNIYIDHENMTLEKN